MQHDEINAQQALLQTARTHLATLLRQQFAFGAHTPAYILTEIAGYRDKIAQIKQSLRSAGVPVDDHAQDTPGPEASNSAAPTQPSLSSGLNLSGDIVFGNKIDGDHVGGSKYTFNAPITAGAASFGGEQRIDKLDVTQGDSFNISNVSGAILNIKSRLDHVQQQISTLPGADQAAKAELAALVARLNTLVQQVPAALASEATRLATRAAELVAEAQKPAPDSELVAFNLERLRKSAEIIGVEAPVVRAVALEFAERLRAFLQS